MYNKKNMKNMKKLFLVSALTAMTFVFLASTASVKAQSTKTTSTTVVTKDNSATPAACCKAVTIGSCDKSKCDKSKCDKSKCDKSKCTGKCTHSGTSCTNSPGCKMAGTSNTTSMQRKSCSEAMKTKPVK